jgi:anti-sigma-K factor RskA
MALANDPCAQARDLLPAYSIGATNADETRFVEAHLSTCADLADELRGYAAVTDALLRDLPQSAPPPRVLSTLLAHTAPNTEATPSMPLPALWTAAPTKSAAQTPATPPRAPARPTARNSARVWAWAAAALLVVLLGSNGYWIWQVQQIQSQRAALQQQFAQLQTDLRAQNVSFEVMRAPDARWRRLDDDMAAFDAPPAPDEGYVWVVWSAQQGAGVLMGQNLPRLQAGQVYQLWGHRGAQDTSLTTFSTDAQGRALLPFSASDLDFENYWITAEPQGGSTQPTGAPIVRVRIEE